MTRTLRGTGCGFIRCALQAAILAALVACAKVVTDNPSADTPAAGASTPSSAAAMDPVATVPPISAAATSSPTTTPTPIIHVVQSGDTLLAIAQDYGVSLEALRRANGIDNPQMLRAGQELIIPTGEEESGPVAGALLPTPTPLPVGVRGVSCYETPVGSLQCLGEIVNTTTFTLTNVQVRVTLPAADGEQALTADVFAAADIIQPGERSPFRILFTAPPASWTTPQVTIIRAEAAGQLADSYVPIAVSQIEGQPSDPQFLVRGVVQNTSTEQAAGHVSIIVTTYDEQGTVTASRQAKVEIGESLAPGATASFTVLFDFHGDAPVDFNVIAIGRTASD